MQVFVTGATGFVGRALVNELLREDHTITAAVRNHSAELPVKVEQKVVGDLNLIASGQSILQSLTNIDVIIHTAARVHVMDDKAQDSLTAFRNINVIATAELAKQAAMAGVKRFIFLSSVKVNGESTDNRAAFRETDEPNPEDDYGLSKFEAEQALIALSKTTAMEIVIIRPPLIYGPGVKANFASMINVIKKGMPLPFGAIQNQRSMLAVDNMVDFIKLCMTHPAAANQVFLIGDNEVVSTTELLKKIAKAYKRVPRLIPVPVSWMTFFAKLMGKKNITDRLFGSLQIDISKARHLLEWEPVVSMEQQLKKIAEQDKHLSP